MTSTRKAPMRKCVGCAEMKSKKELVRVVHGAEGGFSIDMTGKKAGRGAYICANAACLARAVKGKGLERSFKTAVPKGVYESLQAEMEAANGSTG